MDKELMVWLAFMIGWWGAGFVFGSEKTGNKILWTVITILLYTILLLVNMVMGG
jgi:hypothetical protein